MIVVSKFGGSSLADAEQFKRVKDIVLSDVKRRVVVVSALGKRNKQDKKITDLLYLISAHIKYGFDYLPLLDVMYERYNLVKTNLGLTIDLDRQFEIIKKNITDNFSEEYLVSRGEFLTALCMAEYLGFQFADASELIKFGFDGKILQDETCKLIESSFERNKKIVVPGFYGTYPNGAIRLFTRGGSDITGSLLAQALKAEKYENFTDVSGIFMADPTIVDNPKRISEITYDELRELSYMGASVLHEETVFPIQDLNIPICILNTFAPEQPGTIIRQNTENNQIVTGIAGKKNFKSFTIVKKRSSNKLTVIRSCLEVFDRYHVPVENIPTSIDTFSVVVEGKPVERTVYELIADLKKIDDVVDVIVDDDLALIAVVGKNMATRPGISGRIFNIFGKNNINIKMIAQGSQEINIIVGVSNSNLQKSIRAIYSELIQ